ncbi:hypothetical protein Q8F57_019595 [Paraburkholderia terrae]|uniref:hypothetical protein n=1 Tax=Paraburkholderia terrae TaxID=311230 RepID=UPI00296AD9CD|nr:hypothetical protein [Paraburkholderia terrae]MDW3662708.1 hypothetical protein [Paraburkholderia terrae]
MLALRDNGKVIKITHDHELIAVALSPDLAMFCTTAIPVSRRDNDYELFIADTSVVLSPVFTSSVRIHIIRSSVANRESRTTNPDSQQSGDDMSFADWLDMRASGRAIISGMPGISNAAALIAPPTRAYCQQELPCKTISFLKSRRVAALSA